MLFIYMHISSIWRNKSWNPAIFYLVVSSQKAALQCPVNTSCTCI